LFICTTRTVKVIEREPVSNILAMDENGDGEISKMEYIIFMLRELREVDPHMIDILATQFEVSRIQAL
jgi:hypothetical protein